MLSVLSVGFSWFDSQRQLSHFITDTFLHSDVMLSTALWHNWWSEEELSAVHKNEEEMEIHSWRVLHIKISYEGDGSVQRWS